MPDVGTNGAKRRRNKPWSKELKREISIVARQYDVNANQVFRWRQLADESDSTTSSASSSGLVLVTITPEPEDKAAPAQWAHSDKIEIEVGGECRMRVCTSFDGRPLKRVLDVLRESLNSTLGRAGDGGSR